METNIFVRDFECLEHEPGNVANVLADCDNADTEIAALQARIMQARIWAKGNDLVTLTDASEITGIGVKTLSSLVDRGKLTRYTDTSEPNPRRQTRVDIREVEEYARTRVVCAE